MEHLFVDREDITDLTILLDLLLIKDEYVYTCILNKVKVILSKYIDCSSSTTNILPYSELKLNVHTDLRVGLSFATRKAQVPYISSYASDTKRFRNAWQERFKLVLCHINTMDNLYGALSNDNTINWTWYIN